MTSTRCSACCHLIVKLDVAQNGNTMAGNGVSQDHSSPIVIKGDLDLTPLLLKKPRQELDVLFT